MEVLMPTSLLSGMNVGNLPEDARYWLMHRLLPMPQRAEWLDSSIALHKEALGDQPCIMDGDHPRSVNATFLLLCEYDFKDFALGHMDAMSHPLVPVYAGNPIQSRFLILENQSEPTVMTSTAYDTGYIVIGKFQPMRSKTSVANLIMFHKDTPHKLEMEISAVESLRSKAIVELPWPQSDAATAAGLTTHNQLDKDTLMDMATLESSTWTRFQKFVTLSMHSGWRELTIKPLLREGFKAQSVPIFSGFIGEGTFLDELKQSYIARLSESLLEKNVVSSLSLFENVPGSPLSECDNLGKMIVLKSRGDADNTMMITKSSNLSTTTVVVPDASKAAPEAECPRCHATFRRKYELKRHADTVHDGVRKHACEVCGKTFTQLAHVRVHVDTVHNKSRACVCEICGQAFGTRHKLSRHKRSVHERSRPHTCHLCDCAYFQNSDLKRHMRAKHGAMES